MDLQHPAAVDGPEKSGARIARTIATAAEQDPGIPPQLRGALGLLRVQEDVAIVHELPPTMLRDARHRTVMLKTLDALDPSERNAPIGANWLPFSRRSRRSVAGQRCRGYTVARQFPEPNRRQDQIRFGPIVSQERSLLF
jgi:hypothetical protein